MEDTGKVIFSKRDIRGYDVVAYRFYMDKERSIICGRNT